MSGAAVLTFSMRSPTCWHRRAPQPRLMVLGAPASRPAVAAAAPAIGLTVAVALLLKRWLPAGRICWWRWWRHGGGCGAEPSGRPAWGPGLGLPVPAVGAIHLAGPAFADLRALPDLIGISFARPSSLGQSTRSPRRWRSAGPPISATGNSSASLSNLIGGFFQCYVPCGLNRPMPTTPCPHATGGSFGPAAAGADCASSAPLLARFHSGHCRTAFAHCRVADGPAGWTAGGPAGAIAAATGLATVTIRIELAIRWAILLVAYLHRTCRPCTMCSIRRAGPQDGGAGCCRSLAA
jgi:hypothetical protein